MRWFTNRKAGEGRPMLGGFYVHSPLRNGVAMLRFARTEAEALYLNVTMQGTITPVEKGCTSSSMTRTTPIHSGQETA